MPEDGWVQTPADSEIQDGRRFAFGRNWAGFLASLDERRIARAVDSLRKAFQQERLDGLRFLDAGSGSGLFSLAARRLGARVHSFDFDPQSVACTQELRRRHFPQDPDWQVVAGSVLDREFLASLGPFEIVYSWGVLHHTGALWTALENVSERVASGGRLCVAIYNDQGRASRRWLRVKQLYNRLPGPLRGLVIGPAFLRLWGPTLLRDLCRGRPLRSWTRYAETSRRGMSAWHDVIDWVGGLPFEVATPEAVFRFCRDRGFQLQELLTCGGGLGCNEFVFVRQHEPASTTA